MPIQRNARVIATDGELGRVTHVIVDPHTNDVTELVVARDRDQWVISMDAVASVEGDRVLLREARSRFFMISSPFRRDAFQPADPASLHTRAHDSLPQPGAPRQGGEIPTAAPVNLRMRREVREWVETLTVTLRAERLVLEVLPGDGPATFDGRVLQPGETYELLLTTERARVVKDVVTGIPDDAPSG